MGKIPAASSSCCGAADNGTAFSADTVRSSCCGSTPTLPAKEGESIPQNGSSCASASAEGEKALHSVADIDFNEWAGQSCHFIKLPFMCPWRVCTDCGVYNTGSFNIYAVKPATVSGG
jgi:hypothetical protein